MGISVGAWLAIRRAVGFGAVAGATLLASHGADAAGGAQTVDDAAVETPGVCHLETWASRTGKGDYLLNFGPACTLAALPRLEFDVAVQQTRMDGIDDTTLIPGLKFAAADLGHGISIAIEGNFTWSTLTDRVETTDLIVPLTAHLGQDVQISLNLGWEWNRTGVSHRAYYGAQAVWTTSETTSLMVEGFGYSDGVAGYQAGIRWTPVPWLDVDFLAGRLDNISRHALTIGLTGRY